MSCLRPRIWPTSTLPLPISKCRVSATRPRCRQWSTGNSGTRAFEHKGTIRRRHEKSESIGVFAYEHCRTDGKTTITFRYYHAVGADKTPTSDYELFETI